MALRDDCLREFVPFEGGKGHYYSLPALEEKGLGNISRLPVSIRIVLESVLRNADNDKITDEDVKDLAGWNAKNPADKEIPFVVSRIVLQDFTGVPLVVDLAAMRSAARKLGKDPNIVEPLVPVDLVVDHSVQVDFFGTPQALQLNLEMEFKRNRERYEMLKWAQQAFETFGLVPPGIGIVHQVNLEYLAKGVLNAPFNGSKMYYPDTLVGTDSHTTMINGLGVVGWGVGGIEAEAGMLGQPVYFLTPEVVGVHMTGELKQGVTATDLVLHVTQLLRETKVVGKFVEFYGEGAAKLTLPDRATIGNMSPEYGATIGFFPVDDETINYMRATGRSEEVCSAFENYYKAQNLFGIPREGEVDYSVNVHVDLGDVEPSVAGPKRPQDRITLSGLGEKFRDLIDKPKTEGGFGLDPSVLEKEYTVEFDQPITLNGGGKMPEQQGQDAEPRHKLEMVSNRPTPDVEENPEQFPRMKGTAQLKQGDVLIAAITSCTNTSNPTVMIGAGLLAKNAVERGLTVNPLVKTSLAPGSRVVQDYLSKSGLQEYLDQLGFQIVGYGCTTCIGNSGPLKKELEDALNSQNVVAASVLSGNRNFEARIHGAIRANFLMSPPLVVAFALAGNVNIDMSSQPIGADKDGNEVYLHDLWPSMEEIKKTMQANMTPEVFEKLYTDFEEQNPKWNEIPAKTGEVYDWDPESTYIQHPPFFEGFDMQPGEVRDISGARVLGIFGDSTTTDHISPAGSIKPDSPAGQYLQEHGVEPKEFNSFGSRRGNDLVMTRGTFGNVRIKNLMLDGKEGGFTLHQPSGEEMSIYDAAVKYREEDTPLIVIGGEEYGTGSSRDWAAKGTLLLGVKAVVVSSYERIHRSNLIGMGVMPLQFKEGTNYETLGLDGTETYSIKGIEDNFTTGAELTLIIQRANGETEEVPVTLRLDTKAELDYYRHGGILPYVLRQLVEEKG